ncbi:long-chain-fatty-acid--CoA ligase 5-like isoform X2 [Ptychodera flava]|uniref:long-chain-fatty-acid--CoA ligase 5-like isoform X2 n=1 Tax=Ptychodera flava TaxID=63121 RepID=UPI00396A6E13
MKMYVLQNNSWKSHFHLNNSNTNTKITSTATCHVINRCRLQERLNKRMQCFSMSDVLKSFEKLSSDIGVGQAVAIGTVAGILVYYYATRPKPVTPPFDVQHQSIELPDTDHVRRSPFCKDGELVKQFFDDVTTLYDGFQRGIRESRNGPCLGHRPGPGQPYVWISYKEVEQRAASFGSALLHKGCKPGPETLIGVYSKNRTEWVVAEQACNMFSMVVVPLYDTLGPDACTHIINRTEIQYVVVEQAKQIKSIVDSASKTPNLKCIIAIDDVPEEYKELAVQGGLEIISFSEMEALGQDYPHEPVPPKPEYLATICFTSGTTGNPKGVCLSHGNIVAMASSLGVLGENAIELSADDVHLSYLPLAHMFERMAQAWYFAIGSQIGFYQGDVKLLMDDLKELKPTVFCSVPRLLNRVYDKIMSNVNGASFIARTLFKTAIYMKKRELERGVVRNDSIWDKIVFKKIQSSLGGRVKVIISGAAPLSAEITSFLRCCFGCYVFEGYGQTEAGAAITLTVPGDHSVGHVGSPVACNLVKLVDVPEMQYYAENNQGEVCAKGTNIFSGYYKEPEKTAETIDEDGWLHTGDIGEWLPNGALKIIDRKKNIFKLAQGEYIAPEKVENIYVRSQLVAQVFVHGDSLKSCLVGVVVPDEDTLPKLGTSLGITGSFEELCENKAIKDAILEDMIKIGKEAGLYSFEQVKDIYLQSELCSVENGLMTPTFKYRRAVVRSHFSKQFEEMYGRLA